VVRHWIGGNRKRDVVGQILWLHAKNNGIKPGIYLVLGGIRFFGVNDFKVNGEGDFKGKPTAMVQ